MNKIFVTGRGTYLPKLVHTNETLPPLEKELTQEQFDRIGVTSRHWASSEEGVAEMAAWASQEALEKASLSPTDIDLIILANWTQRRYIPDIAPKLQKLLGARKIFAFDISGACTGFINGIGIAHSFLQNERCNRALVVASETLSQRGKPRSRSTLINGDGAGAWILEKEKKQGMEIIDFDLSTDGDHHAHFAVNATGYVETFLPQSDLVVVAAKNFADAGNRVLERNKLTLNDIAWIVPHSGTAGVQAAYVKIMGVPEEKMLSNFNLVGNVAAASIPLSFEHYVNLGKIKRGDLVLSPSTGAGMFSAAMLYRV